MRLERVTRGRVNQRKWYQGAFPKECLAGWWVSRLMYTERTMPAPAQAFALRRCISDTKCLIATPTLLGIVKLQIMVTGVVKASRKLFGSLKEVIRLLYKMNLCCPPKVSRRRKVHRCCTILQGSHHWDDQIARAQLSYKVCLTVKRVTDH